MSHPECPRQAVLEYAKSHGAQSVPHLVHLHCPESAVRLTFLFADNLPNTLSRVARAAHDLSLSAALATGNHLTDNRVQLRERSSCRLPRVSNFCECGVEIIHPDSITHLAKRP